MSISICVLQFRSLAFEFRKLGLGYRFGLWLNSLQFWDPLVVIKLSILILGFMRVFSVLFPPPLFAFSVWIRFGHALCLGWFWYYPHSALIQFMTPLPASFMLCLSSSDDAAASFFDCFRFVSLSPVFFLLLCSSLLMSCSSASIQSPPLLSISLPWIWFWNNK